MVIAIVLLLGFIGVEIAGYLFHRLMHTRWLGPLHRAHMAHHLKMYPAQSYLSPTYRNTGIDSTTNRFIAFGVLLGVLALVFLPLIASLPIVCLLVGVGGLNSYLHDSNHIDGHWLEKYNWFIRIRQIHYIHHLDMTRNFGIVTFFTDRIFGTYEEP